MLNENESIQNKGSHETHIKLI